MKTLVVDDDYTSRLLLWEILKQYGTVHIVSNGQEAVEAVRDALKIKNSYHLICLDIMMPEMNGQSVLQEIRRLEEQQNIPRDKRSKIIMITALADKANVIKAAQNQCDQFLLKPIDKKILLENIEKLKLI